MVFSTVLPFRAPASSLFWLFPAPVFSISYLLPSDFLHAWASSWLCFSTVHIVGSFTSNLSSKISYTCKQTRIFRSPCLLPPRASHSSFTQLRLNRKGSSRKESTRNMPLLLAVVPWPVDIKGRHCPEAWRHRVGPASFGRMPHHLAKSGLISDWPSALHTSIATLPNRLGKTIFCLPSIFLIFSRK